MSHEKLLAHDCWCRIIQRQLSSLKTDQWYMVVLRQCHFGGVQSICRWVRFQRFEHWNQCLKRISLVKCNVLWWYLVDFWWFNEVLRSKRHKIVQNRKYGVMIWQCADQKNLRWCNKGLIYLIRRELKLNTPLSLILLQFMVLW